ncbi:SNF2-related protein [Romboutsia sp.]|uniref:DEAD/DEAH box helicase n=1 Tax=Romboutsia sp. TaxID=1965302 RepID=UPI003F3ECDFC
MITNKITNNMREITDQIRWIRGVNYYQEDNVLDLEIEFIENKLNVLGYVDGSSYSEYHTKLIIDTKTLKVDFGLCQCKDFEDNHKKRKKLYPCKHLVATLLEFIYKIEDTEIEKELQDLYNMQNMQTKQIEIGMNTPKPKNNKPQNNESKSSENSKPSIEDIILNIVGKEKEKINLEVNIDAATQHPYVKVDFKIGKDKMYILKSADTFTEARIFNRELVYGKEFTYNPENHHFAEEDEAIAGFIDEMVAINRQLSVVPKYKRQIELVEGKTINVLGKSLKRFLLTLNNKPINFTINNSTYKSKILKEDLPLNFNIEDNGEELILTADENMPIPLNSNGEAFFYNGDIYLPSFKQYNEYMKFYTPLKMEHKIKFKKDNAKKVITHVIPSLDEISTTLKIDEKIEKKIKKDLTTKFYIDKKKDEVVLDLKLIYAEDENQDYYIIRDTKKEKLAKSTLNKLKFEESTSNQYKFIGNEYDLFSFLSEEVKELKELGEVYYSDNFKYKIEKPNVKASIKSESDGKFLEVNFEIEDIENKDYKDILNALKKNQRFYKLKNDVILDLKDEKLNDFFEVMGNLTQDIYKDLNNKKLKLHNNKVIYLDEMLKNEKLNFIEGKDKINSIANKIKTKDNIDHTIPTELNATLRSYQEEGYKFFNTLSHYEFGGILADEMGLGKTIQAISFLLSQKDKKSIVVTPTSLIYNWKDEIENFAPNLKVLIMHGDKSQRIEAFESINDYDLILTTYATLRNDFDYYKEMYFDYMIIDEAQNIKNPYAQNTETVKNINAKVKFALTGTPMENNLVELWSIFDYLMPGYLFSKKSFESKFVNSKEENIKELKKMINPFILRRLKKDVLKELPDKIEKKFFVEMDKEQKKIYKALVDDINEKRSSEEFKEDKITIFSYLTKLRQLCLDPSVLIENYTGKSAKADIGINIIKSNIEENHKILLFSQFTSVLKNLGQRLEEEGISYSYLDGSVNAAKRIELVKDFNENEENKVFLISLKAGGTGLNLTSADVVIHFDPWWNPAIEDQATDRAHRFGQKNVVEVIKLIAKGTVEEKIIKMQESKKELIEKVMSGDMNNSGVLSSLSKEDLDELFMI